MKFKRLFFFCLLAWVFAAPRFSYGAGTTVYFGRNSGTGCAGSGVCQIGADAMGGVHVTFEYIGDDGNHASVLTLTFDYEKGKAAGFNVTQGQKTYRFIKGYKFSDPALAKACGLPTGYEIADGYLANYIPPNENNGGVCSLIITKQVD